LPLANIDEDAIVRAPDGDALSVAFRLHAIGLGYNTKLMTKEKAPKTYQDLLDPKWKGKMALSGGNVAYNWLGAVLRTHGEEFVKKVAQQDFVTHTFNARALFDLIIAGEYPFSPSILSSHVMQNKQKGASVDWLPLEPVGHIIGSVALPKHSTHPHAAMLLVDLKFSREIAELQKASGYMTTHKGVPVERTYKKFYGAQSMAEGVKWQNMYMELFVKK